jgi:CHAT domain-containing protein/tetratricopeptide (TPR) repeat protein
MTITADHTRSLLQHIADWDLDAARNALAASDDLPAVHAALADEAERLAVADTAAAIRATEKLQSLADQLNIPATRARIRRARGQALAYANRFQDALVVLEEARAIAATDAPHEAARAAVAMVHALARLGKLREAAKIGEIAHAELTKLGEPLLAAKAAVNLGVICRMLDRPRQAIEHFDHALPVLSDNPVIAAQIQSNRGEAMLDLAEFAAAEQAFIAALDAFNSAGAKRAASIAEGNLADLLSRQGRLGKALHHFERARARLEEDAAPADAARLAIEKAEAQFAVGLLQEAHSTYLTAIPILEEHGLVAETARARLGFAKVLTLLGDLILAVEMAQLAGKSYHEIGQHIPAARAQIALGQILLMKGHIDSGFALVRKALEKLADRPAELAAAHALLADAALQAQDHHRALVESGIGLHLAERAAMVHLIPVLRTARGQARRALDMLPEAVEDLDIAAEEIARLRGTLSLDRFRAVFASSHAEISAQAVSAHLELGAEANIARAFALVQIAKGGSLLDLLSADAAAAEPDAASTGTEQGEGQEHAETSAPMFDHVRQASQRLRALVNQVLERGSGLPSDDLAAKIAAAEQELESHQARLLAQADYRELVSAPAPLSAIQAILPRGGDSERNGGWLLVEYFIAGEDLLAFLVSPTSLECIPLGPISALVDPLERLEFQQNRAIARTAAGARQSPPESTHSPLLQLFDLLLRPIGDRLWDAQGLIIAPAGPLHAVPFHALRSRDAYLCERLPTLQTPSASVLVHLKNRPLPNRWDRGPLLLAVPDETAPGLLDEATALHTLIPGSELVAGSQATAQTLRQSCAGRPLIHLACHGAFPPGIPGAAGLKLADGWMTAPEIARLPLAGSVVTLSGCETGRAFVAAGEELTGLVRSFMAAGATAILASLTATHDQTSTKIVGNLYQQWYSVGRPSGNSLADALQKVRCQAIAEGVHPAFWSPFFVIGVP